jgi:hypothetical protein
MLWHNLCFGVDSALAYFMLWHTVHIVMIYALI